MTFDNLLDLQPNVRLADLIQLFLMGYDDKNLCKCDYTRSKLKRTN